MEEEPKVNQQQEQSVDPKPTKKKRAWGTTIRNVVIGDIFSTNIFVKNIPYLIFLAMIALGYISNTYYAEKAFRQIEKTKGELKELRFHYVSTKSKLMYNSKLSEIASRVQKFGLKETTKPPYKIFYNKDDYRKDQPEE